MKRRRLTDVELSQVLSRVEGFIGEGHGLPCPMCSVDIVTHGEPRIPVTHGWGERHVESARDALRVLEARGLA